MKTEDSPHHESASKVVMCVPSVLDVVARTVKDLEGACREL